MLSLRLCCAANLAAAKNTPQATSSTFLLQHRGTLYYHLSLLACELMFAVDMANVLGQLRSVLLLAT